MATSTFSIRYRPVKIGFLVRNGYISDIVKASGINTLLWGGIYNPIIPTFKDIKLSKLLIDLSKVDILFPISNTKEIGILLKEYEYRKSPHYPGREIFFKEWNSKKNELGCLDIIHIIDYYWEKEFKNESKRYKSNCALIEWGKKDVLSNLFTVMFGIFPKSLNLKDDYIKDFLEGLKAKKFLIKNRECINKGIAQLINPLSLTRDRLVGDSTGIFENGVYVGDPGSFEDLLAFWNLRASGIDLQFLPTNSKRLNSFICKHLSRLDRLPNRHPNIEDFISVFSRNSNNAKTYLSKFITKKNKGFCHFDNIILDSLKIKPYNFYFDYHQVLGNVDYRFNRYSVSIALPKKPVNNNSRNTSSQNIVVVIDSLSEYEYPNHTLKLPFIQELNEFYSRQVVSDPWMLRVDKEGFGLINRISDSIVNLYPIPNIRLIEKIFDFVGIQTEISQPGRLTYQIIQQMGEDNPLEACRVFKIRGVRKLIKTVSGNNSVKWKEALKIIGSNSFNKFKQLAIERRTKPELTPQDVWNYLIKKKIFSPVLLRNVYSKKKKSFSCTRCGLKSKITYNSFTKIWTCNCCKHEQYLPEFINNVFGRNEIDIWSFKRSGLFLKDNNQEGAVPVIITLLQIMRGLPHFSNFIYATPLNLKPKNGTKCETDFVALNYRNGERLEICIGECKSDNGKIDQNDINNLKNIKSHFKTKGINCYLLFSKTADKFAKDEIKLFKKLNAEGINPILFTNKELEPYLLYEEYDTVPLRKYTFTFGDIASNSARIYLNN